MSSTKKKEATCFLDFNVNSLGDCRKPTASDQGSHDNCWLAGGSKQFTISVPICQEVVDPDADATDRVEALRQYSRIMGDLHLVGGDFSKPTDQQQAFLIQPSMMRFSKRDDGKWVPDEDGVSVVDKFNEIDDWCLDQYVKHQQEWFGQTKSMETCNDRQRAIWKPDKKNTGGDPCFNARGFQFSDKSDGNTKVFVQSPDDFGDFEEDCSFKDIPKGSVAILTIDISGMRIKDDKFGLITPTIKEAYILVGGSGETAPATADGVHIRIKKSTAKDRAKKMVEEAATVPDPGTDTMINVGPLVPDATGATDATDATGGAEDFSEPDTP
jgi:hypothetical protein